jgi:hypothetical protein
LACACGSGGPGLDLPSQQELEAAKQNARAGIDLAERARQALELLGLLPTYECGEPRATFLGRAVAGLEAEVACATVSTEALSAEEDAVRIEFAAEGCQARGVSLSGPAVFAYSGGTDRFSLEADLSALEVGGQPLSMRAGYGTCGDQKNFWAAGQGDLPGLAGASFALDVTVGLRGGVPVFGGTSLLLSGSAELTTAAGTDLVELEGLEYELGDVLPGEGLMRIATAGGTHIAIRFSSGFLLGEVEITIDEHDPVSVPVL